MVSRMPDGDLLPGMVPQPKPRAALSRSQLIERIVELNPTATPDFLAAFTDAALVDYLAHLCVVAEPKMPWVRKNDAPAAVQRAASE